MFDCIPGFLRFPLALTLGSFVAAPAVTRAEIETSREQSVAVAQLRDLDVSTITTDIAVVGNETDTISVKLFLTARTNNQEEANELFENVEFKIEERGDELHVVVEPKTERRLFGLLGNRSKPMPKTRLEIVVPAAFSIEIDSVSGDALVRNVIGSHSLDTVSGSCVIEESKGNHHLDSTSGDLTVIASAGSHDLSSTSGNILVRDGAGDISAETTSGDIRIESFPGTHEADSVSGNIYATLAAELADNCEFETVSGSITLEVEADFSARLIADTASGSIELRAQPEQVLKKERDRAEAIFGQGGPTVRLDTVSGGIQVVPHSISL
jgi:DUF4097 and DUF4098 domain-containing protein YvlB